MGIGKLFYPPQINIKKGLTGQADFADYTDYHEGGLSYKLGCLRCVRTEDVQRRNFTAEAQRAQRESIFSFRSLRLCGGFKSLLYLVCANGIIRIYLQFKKSKKFVSFYPPPSFPPAGGVKLSRKSG